MPKPLYILQNLKVQVHTYKNGLAESIKPETKRGPKVNIKPEGPKETLTLKISKPLVYLNSAIVEHLLFRTFQIF